MSTIRKLDRNHRERARDRVGRMLRTGVSSIAARDPGVADLLWAVSKAIDIVRKDSTRSGAAKQRIYNQILNEYMLNVQSMKLPNNVVTAAEPK